jgi:hypothetical protein
LVSATAVGTPPLLVCILPSGFGTSFSWKIYLLRPQSAKHTVSVKDAINRVQRETRYLSTPQQLNRSTLGPLEAPFATQSVTQPVNLQQILLCAM